MERDITFNTAESVLSLDGATTIAICIIVFSIIIFIYKFVIGQRKLEDYISQKVDEKIDIKLKQHTLEKRVILENHSNRLLSLETLANNKMEEILKKIELMSEDITSIKIDMARYKSK